MMAAAWWSPFLTRVSTPGRRGCRPPPMAGPRWAGRGVCGVWATRKAGRGRSHREARKVADNVQATAKATRDASHHTASFCLNVITVVGCIGSCTWAAAVV